MQFYDGYKIPERYSVSDVLAEMEKQHPRFGKSMPDMTLLSKMLASVDINGACQKTGLTPLIWTIEHDSPLFMFCLSRGADVNVRGTGEHDVAPIERAVAKGLMEKAD